MMTDYFGTYFISLSMQVFLHSTITWLNATREGVNITVIFAGGQYVAKGIIMEYVMVLIIFNDVFRCLDSFDDPSVRQEHERLCIASSSSGLGQIEIFPSPNSQFRFRGHNKLYRRPLFGVFDFDKYQVIEISFR